MFAYIRWIYCRLVTIRVLSYEEAGGVVMISPLLLLLFQSACISVCLGQTISCGSTGCTLVLDSAAYWLRRSIPQINRHESFSFLGCSLNPTDKPTNVPDQSNAVKQSVCYHFDKLWYWDWLHEDQSYQQHVNIYESIHRSESDEHVNDHHKAEKMITWTW